MGKEIWTLKAQLRGNFMLLSEEHLNVRGSPHPTLRRLHFEPQFNKEKQQSGKFNIEIDFEVEFEKTKSPSNIVADLGRYLLDYYLNILTFSSGYPAHVVDKPSLHYNYPGTNNYRTLMFPSEQIELLPPVPIVSTALISSISVDSKQNRILGWFRKGIQEKDVINSLLALFVSLEILANQFKITSTAKKFCEICGHETELKPGMRLKVENFLCKEVGYNPEQFKLLWDTRNKISHGGFDLSPEELRGLQHIKREVVVAIIRGIKKLLNLSSTDPPRESNRAWEFADPILDLEYSLPGPDQHTSK